MNRRAAGAYGEGMKTKPKVKLLHTLAAATLLVPVAAFAELAVTTQGVNMRAGPDISYPQVAVLGRGVSVNVVGCAAGWQWCDVMVGSNRGWVYAGYLSYRYNNTPTVISYGGPALGIPLISFSIGPYWDSYYRGRPWWNNRAYWYGHPVARGPAWHAPPHYANNGHDNHEPRDHEGHGNPGHGNEAHGNAHSGNDYHAGSIPGPYTRAEGGNRDAFGGNRPNDSAHPNAQQ